MTDDELVAILDRHRRDDLRHDDVPRLVAEVRRLARGEFSPDEFQALCHNCDERPGCTRAEFEAGCREYQDKLFGERLRQPQTPESGVAAILGQWPGDETDEEIQKALEELS